MDELLEALEDAPNVKKITYDVEMGNWTVQYKKKASSTKVYSEVLIDFLKNA
jgi:hypothetical protein